jgi:methionine-rich copper-binding protein CopC
MKRVWLLLWALSTGDAGAAMALKGPVEAPRLFAEAHRKPVGSVAGGNPFLIAKTPLSQQIHMAHAILVKAQPEKESVISDVPSEVLLTFNEGVGEEFLALAVVDATGKRVDKHDAHQDFTDHSHLRASVETLAPGRYMVRYRVLSADGHVVSGKYFFELKPK